MSDCLNQIFSRRLMSIVQLLQSCGHCRHYNNFRKFKQVFTQQYLLVDVITFIGQPKATITMKCHKLLKVELNQNFCTTHSCHHGWQSHHCNIKNVKQNRTRLLHPVVDDTSFFILFFFYHHYGWVVWTNYSQLYQSCIMPGNSK